MKETGTAARALINPTESEQKAETQIHRPSFRLISGLENTAEALSNGDGLSKNCRTSLQPPSKACRGSGPAIATEALMRHTGLALQVACLTPIFRHL